MEKIKRKAMKEKQLIWNGSYAQSQHIQLNLAMILPASDSRLYITSSIYLERGIHV